MKLTNNGRSFFKKINYMTCRQSRIISKKAAMTEVITMEVLLLYDQDEINRVDKKNRW